MPRPPPPPRLLLTFLLSVSTACYVYLPFRQGGSVNNIGSINTTKIVLVSSSKKQYRYHLFFYKKPFKFQSNVTCGPSVSAVDSDPSWDVGLWFKSCFYAGLALGSLLGGAAAYLSSPAAAARVSSLLLALASLVASTHTEDVSSLPCSAWPPQPSHYSYLSTSGGGSISTHYEA